MPFKFSSFPDHTSELCYQLLKHTSMDINKSALVKIYELFRTNDHGLIRIQKVLQEYNVESLVVNLPKEKLASLTDPFIAELEGRAELVSAVTEDGCTISSQKGHSHTLPMDEFKEQWSGNSLIVISDELFNDPSFLAPSSHKWTGILAILIISMLVWTIQGDPSIFAPVIILKILGFWISYRLMQMSLGKSSVLEQHICMAKKQMSCSEVLSSKASKIGNIPLSDLGFLYFLSSFALLPLIGESILPWLKLISIVILPFTFFSIYYQYRVVKKWCVFCLIILAICWLDVLALWRVDITNLTFPAPHLGLVGLISSTLALKSIQFHLRMKFQNEHLKLNLWRLRRTKEALGGLIRSDRQIKPLPHDTKYLNAIGSAVEVTFILSPVCAHCGQLFDRIVKAAEALDSEVTVKIGFMSIKNEVAYQVAYHLTKWESQAWIEAAKSWYELPKVDESLDKWTDMYSLQSSTEMSQFKRTMDDWVEKSSIDYTPLILLNDKLVHKEVSLDDLIYYLINFQNKTSA